MKLCKTSPYIRKYLWALPAPSFIAACYVDFFDEFIERYLAETKRIMFHSPSMLNKEELAKTVKALYEEVLKLRKIDEEEQLVAVELQNI